MFLHQNANFLGCNADRCFKYPQVDKMVKQKELNKQIIEEWNKSTSKDIKENPTKYFQNDQQA